MTGTMTNYKNQLFFVAQNEFPQVEKTHLMFTQFPSDLHIYLQFCEKRSLIEMRETNFAQVNNESSCVCLYSILIVSIVYR